MGADITKADVNGGKWHGQSAGQEAEGTDPQNVSVLGQKLT